MSDKNNDTSKLDELQEKLLESKRELAKKLPILGNVVWLYQNSEHQRFLFFRDIEHRLMPPLMIEQFKLYLDSKTGGLPMAYVSWAYLSDEAEEVYINTQRIAPKDWKSGKNLWIVDSVSPYAEGQQLFQQAYEELFKGKDVNILFPDEHGAMQKMSLLDLAQKVQNVKSSDKSRH